MNISVNIVERRRAPRRTTARRPAPLLRLNNDFWVISIPCPTSQKGDKTFECEGQLWIHQKEEAARLDQPFKGNAFFDEHDRNVFADRI